MILIDLLYYVILRGYHAYKTLQRRLERARSNHLIVQDKLKLIATVHQSQPMIQSLLSTPDYVAALDVISTTQEILLQELNGIHSFRYSLVYKDNFLSSYYIFVHAQINHCFTSRRHLGSQLSEMEKLINKMLHTEFERYATADLNRPLVSGDNAVLDGVRIQ